MLTVGCCGGKVPNINTVKRKFWIEADVIN